MDVVKVVLGFYRNGGKDEVIDCTKDLKNWDDVTISLNRSDYTGVVREISTKFEFIGETKDKIDNFYNEYYLGAQIKLNIYQINEQWGYDLMFQGDLDFSTFEKDEYILSINAKDNTLSSIIKANKSTKFDIPTTEVRSDKKLKYDRIKILNRVQWTTDDANEDTTEPYRFVIKQEIAEIGTYLIPIPLAYMSTDTFRCPFEYKDQAQELIKISGGNVPAQVGIVTAINQEPFRINTKFSCKLISGVDAASIVIGKTNGTPIAERNITKNKGTVVNLNAPIISAKGQTFGIFLKIEAVTANTTIEFEYYAPSEKDGYYTRGSIAYVECHGKGREIEYNCIDINKVLNKLITKVYPTVNTVIDTLPFDCVLVSGEDMRELNNAKISTSFNEFSSFMEACFGYTYTINDNTIRFGSREDLFSRDVVKEISSYSELHFSQDTSLIYSKVKVGYNKQDYSNANGRYEFNQPIEYSTGVNLTDNTLELISPYRADGFGFEFKTQEIENDVRDNTFSLEDKDNDKSDKDIFVIEVENNYEYYIVKREYPIFIKNSAFSNNVQIGIDSINILKPIDDKYELGEFGNYYLTSYNKDGSNDTFVFSIVSPNKTISSQNISITVAHRNNGKAIYTNDYIIITIDWDVLNSKLDTFSATQGNNAIVYPVSYECYKTHTLNYNLNPTFCAGRNQFMFLPCTTELKFASSERNSDILVYNGNLEKIYKDLSFGGRDMTVNKITFNTDQTLLPADKSGKVRLIANGKTYEGWIISANQNIGRNEASEYELILAKS